MAKKKSVKAGSKAKTKVGKGSVSLRELPGRHMRLTQEFDRLSTVVARQEQLLQGIHLVLQQARLMPYAPDVSPMPAPAKKPLRMEQGEKIILEQQKAGGFPSGRPVETKKYDIVLKRNGQMLGYLTSDGTWTLDPNKVKTWIIHEDAQVMLSKAAVPEGAKAEIRGHN